MTAGILPLFLALVRSGEKDVIVQTLHMFVWVVTLCEQSPDGRLWKSLGVQRLNLHVVMDYISRYVTKEAMDEGLIRFLFEEMVGTKQIEENGRKAVEVRM